ncbi:MAG: Outer rane receptor protein mostly Fe transport [Verrucomicrobiota bacterium]|jgi:outer membrane receptor protein involved in Fe transport
MNASLFTPRPSGRCPGRVFAISFLLIAVSSSAVALAQTKVESKDSVVKLQPFTINASSAVGYGAQDASSSSRLNLPYIDIPQSISVMTAGLLKDATVFTSRDIIKWVNNVIPRTNGSANETWEVRGLIITDSYRDGFLVSAAVTRDAALYDRIEFVKGPASAAIGRGQAGGLVNYVSKKPTRQNALSSNVIVGTDKFFRFDLDSNRILSKNLSARVPVYFEDGDGTYGGELSHTRKYGIGPSVLWNIAPAAELLTNLTLFRHEGPGQSAETDFMDDRSGTIFRLRQSVGQMIGSAWNPYSYPKVPLKSGWGFPGIGLFDNVGEISTVLTYRLSDAISYRTGLYLDGYNEQRRFINKIANTLADPNDPKNFLVPLLYTYSFARAQQARHQGDMIYSKTIGRSSHQVVLGYDIFDRMAAQKSGNFSTNLFDNLYNPRHIPPPNFNFYTSAPLTSKTKTSSGGYGYYVQYLGSFWQDKIKLMGGVRRDTTETVTHNIVTNQDVALGKLTTTAPRYSVSYKPVPSMSLYYLRSHQEDPPVTQLRYTSFVASNGAILPAANDPRRNEFITGQLKAELDEIGFKGNFLKNKWTATVSLYRIRRNGALASTPINQPQPTPQFPQAQLVYSETYLTKGEEYKGFESEIYGQIDKRLTLIFGYSVPRGRTIFQNRLSPGASLIRTARLFAKYNLCDANGEGFEFSTGLRQLFGNWTIRSNSAVKFEKDQYGVDAGVAYYWKRGAHHMRLYATNLTNDPQMTGTNSNVELRRVYLSMGSKW